MNAMQGAFLETLHSLRPHVCITAAYGNFLPSKFLSIPEQGTAPYPYRHTPPAQHKTRTMPSYARRTTHSRSNSALWCDLAAECAVLTLSSLQEL